MYPGAGRCHIAYLANLRTNATGTSEPSMYGTEPLAPQLRGRSCCGSVLVWDAFGGAQRPSTHTHKAQLCAQVLGLVVSGLLWKMVPTNLAQPHPHPSKRGKNKKIKLKNP